jgi:hypothetical protein
MSKKRKSGALSSELTSDNGVAKRYCTEFNNISYLPQQAITLLNKARADLHESIKRSLRINAVYVKHLNALPESNRIRQIIQQTDDIKIFLDFCSECVGHKSSSILNLKRETKLVIPCNQCYFEKA